MSLTSYRAAPPRDRILYLINQWLILRLIFVSRGPNLFWVSIWVRNPEIRCRERSWDTTLAA
jgi:hypothetical protein